MCNLDEKVLRAIKEFLESAKKENGYDAVINKIKKK